MRIVAPSMQPEPITRGRASYLAAVAHPSRSALRSEPDHAGHQQRLDERLVGLHARGPNRESAPRLMARSGMKAAGRANAGPRWRPRASSAAAVARLLAKA